MKSRCVALFAVVSLFVAATGCESNTGDITSAPAPVVAQEAAKTYTPEQVAAAKSVMQMVRETYGTVEDDGTRLVVRFLDGVIPNLGREGFRQLITAIADADAVVSGGARDIDFYDETGRKVAHARPGEGVQLDE